MRRVCLVLVQVFLCSGTLFGQQKPDPTALPMPLRELIRKFAAAESENKSVKNNYTYVQDYKVESLGPGGVITGRFHRRSDIVYGDDGRPMEKILYFPPSSLTEVRVTHEDIQDLTGIQPFALTIDEVEKYQLDYVGKEPLDQFTTYIFDVNPLKIRKGERYLQGRIWVEVNDLQIIKVVGQAVPETNDQRFPHFETRRGKVDDRYWFPTYTYADDTLKFKNGKRTHIRMAIHYSDYKKFVTDIRIAIEGDPAPAKKTPEERLKKTFETKPTVTARLNHPEQADSDKVKKVEQLNAEIIKLSNEGKFNEAIPVAESTLANLENSLEADDPYVALALKNLAALYYARDDYGKAEPLLQRALAIWEKRLGRDHVELEQPLTELACVYLAKKDFSNAELLFQRALEMKEKALGRDHLDLEPLLNNLAQVYRAKGNFAKAEALLQRAVEISNKTTIPGQADVAASLTNLAALYQFQGKYAAAETLFKRALEITEKDAGPEHADVATRLGDLAALYKIQGRYAEAERLSHRALSISEKTLGPDDLGVAVALANLAGLYRSEGKYDEAEPLYKRAFDLTEKLYGNDRPEILPSLANLMMFYYARGKQAEAETLIKRALPILEKALGQEHKYIALFAVIFGNVKDFSTYKYNENEPFYRQSLALTEKLNSFLETVEKSLELDNPDFASNFYQMGLLYRAQGRYDEAERLCKRALAITERQLGPEHPEVAAALINLMGVYRDQGKYDEVEPLFKRAIAIYEKALGDEHPDVAESLIDLADLYHLQGRYAEAEPLFRRALKIYEKVLGLEHPMVAYCLNSLASLNQAQGKFDEAESLFKRAIAITEKASGSEYRNVNLLNNLAVLYLVERRFGEAEPLLKRSLAILEKTFGPENPKTATTLRNLATLYVNQGRIGEAEPLFKRALAIWEKAFGLEHPDVALSLNNMAMLYFAQGKYAEVEALLKRATTIMEKTLGLEHSNYALGLNNLSVLSLAKGDIAAAIEYLSRSTNARERDFNRNQAGQSESNKLRYLSLSAGELHQAISLHTQSAPDNLQARRLALTVLLRRKSISLDVMANSFGNLRRHMDSQARVLLDNFTEASARLATLILTGPGKLSVSQYRGEVDRLEKLVDDLQGEISARSEQFRSQFQSVTIQSVQSALPPGTVLIEFGYYYPFDSNANRVGGPRYVAYVLKNQGEPEWVDLGNAETLDAAVDALRRALRNPARDDVKQLARVVDERLMQPVRKLLGQTQRLFISPDGVLNLMPFEALVDEQSQYLVERFAITYLTSGRDLLRLPTHAENQQTPVIIANPDFDDDGSLSGKQTAQAFEKLVDSQRNAALAGAYFKPLPATAQEAKAIEAILSGAKVLTRSQATEFAVKQVQSPNILHIATHGFFLADQKSEISDIRDLVQLSATPSPPIKTSENPLYRSGLALAGANKRKSGNEDGILTALEALGLDLWGTKLVVLSACNTGVGEVKNSEGVYGLRRALTLAGAETQLISLWAVSDAATRDLMVDYYKGLKIGQGRNEALRQVQLKMLHSTDRFHPFYWASFIQSGEWGDLNGKRPE